MTELWKAPQRGCEPPASDFVVRAGRSAEQGCFFQHREGGPTRRPRERKTGGDEARESAAAARMYAHQSDPDSPARRARTRPPYAAMSAASAAKQTQNWAEGRSGPCHIDFADRASSLGRGAGRDGGGVSTHAAALDGRRGVPQHPPLFCRPARTDDKITPAWRVEEKLRKKVQLVRLYRTGSRWTQRRQLPQHLQSGGPETSARPG